MALSWTYDFPTVRDAMLGETRTICNDGSDTARVYITAHDTGGPGTSATLYINGQAQSTTMGNDIVGVYIVAGETTLNSSQLAAFPQFQSIDVYLEVVVGGSTLTSPTYTLMIGNLIESVPTGLSPANATAMTVEDLAGTTLSWTEPGENPLTHDYVLVYSWDNATWNYITTSNAPTSYVWSSPPDTTGHDGIYWSVRTRLVYPPYNDEKLYIHSTPGTPVAFSAYASNYIEFIGGGGGPSPSASPSSSPSASVSASGSASPSTTPSASISASPSVTPSASGSATPSSSPSLESVEDTAVAPWYGRALFPIVERLTWSTDILTGRTKSEQRICRRTIPLQIYEIDYLLADSYTAAEWSHVMHTWRSRRWPVPAWGEATPHAQSLAAGSTSIAIETACASYRAGSLAMVYRQGRGEYVEIATVGVSALSLSAGLAQSYAGGAWIVPTRRGWLVDHARRQRLANGGSIVRMVFAVEDLAAVTGHTAAATYDGLEVWTTAARLSQTTWDETTDPQSIRSESFSGKVRIVGDADFALTTQPHGWACRTKAEVWSLRQRLHAVYGRQKSFLVPSYQRDLLATRTLASGATSLYVANRSLTTMSTNTLRTYVGLRPPGGSLIVRKVTAISSVSDSEEQIALDAAPGVAIPAGSLICWVDRCRLAEDEIEIIWRKRGQATCETRLARIEE